MQVLQRKQSQRAATPGQPLQKLGQLYRPIYLAEAQARLRSAVESERPWIERLVHFWSNHFAVSADKLAVTGIAGAYEREAIRPHVLGSFTSMLLAVEQHPAMLLYLDNQRSIGPNSRAAALRLRRHSTAGRQPTRADINENLAREALELHTLGVGSGYTQTDVTTFAKVLTGWSVSGGPGDDLANAGRFEFRASWHEPGEKTVFGVRYRQDGLEQGLAVLHTLARHPATATHIATKLARHFVADEPPPGLVARLAHAFLDSDGDLPTVYRALLESEQTWSTEVGKFKTPTDYIVSAYRALQVTDGDERRSFATFELLGQRPWSPGSPAGWPDRTEDWDGAAALYKRVEWAAALAARLGSRRVAADLAPAVLGRRLSERTRLAIGRADSATQALTLLLASPDFMRRPA